jgi:hypothetical protein
MDPWDLEAVPEAYLDSLTGQDDQLALTWMNEFDGVEGAGRDG